MRGGGGEGRGGVGEVGGLCMSVTAVSQSRKVRVSVSGGASDRCHGWFSLRPTMLAFLLLLLLLIMGDPGLAVMA